MKSPNQIPKVNFISRENQSCREVLYLITYIWSIPAVGIMTNGAKCSQLGRPPLSLNENQYFRLFLITFRSLYSYPPSGGVRHEPLDEVKSHVAFSLHSKKQASTGLNARTAVRENLSIPLRNEGAPTTYLEVMSYSLETGTRSAISEADAKVIKFAQRQKTPFEHSKLFVFK